MGYSTKLITFFSDEIELDVHSASCVQHIGHTSIRHFAEWVFPQPVRLEQRDDNDEYIVSSGTPGTDNFVFMTGPEI